jgi:hypothetical protein
MLILINPPNNALHPTAPIGAGCGRGELASGNWSSLMGWRSGYSGNYHSQPTHYLILISFLIVACMWRAVWILLR